MITLVAALSQNNCIGKNGKLLWQIKEDMEHFKKITTGHIVLMGRKTWESIPEKFRPLSNRKNIVITRQENYFVPEGVELSSTLEEALKKYKNQNIMVIGGAEIYKQVFPQADVLEITHVHESVEGDAFFPQIDRNMWHEKNREDFEKFSFVTYSKEYGTR